MAPSAEKNHLFIHLLQSQSGISFPPLILPPCDWELVQVVLRVTNEELAGRDTEEAETSGERERR